MGGLLKSSVAKKFAMALSGLFLVLFLAQHFTINLTSVISPDTFNSWSHFMGTNILVQGIYTYFGCDISFYYGFCFRNSKQKCKAEKLCKI